MNNEQFEYTVVSYNTDPEGRSQQSVMAKVLASSPQTAALKVLQEELFTIGDASRLRARVTHTSIAGAQRITMLYSKI